MNSTSAALAIIHALCPGPGWLTTAVVNPAGMFPAASLSVAVGSALRM